MLVLGLTGGIGAGKSTVASMLGRRGALIVDVDALGREVLAPGGPACRRVIERFGSDVVQRDGGVDRARLAALVFKDDGALAALEAISHPLINAQLARIVRQARTAGAGLVVMDMAVLVESRLGYDAGGRRLYDRVAVVEAPWEVRLARLVQRGLGRGEALSRRDAQATDAERRSVADFLVTNDGTLQRLRVEVDRLWDNLVGSG